MTVSELIEELKQYPMDAIVVADLGGLVIGDDEAEINF